MQRRRKRTNPVVLTVITAAAIAFAVPLTLVISGFALPCQYEKTFLGGLKHKLDALENTQGKRIVTVGGSGTAFALKSEYIESCLEGYSAINFGMYADMGTSVMLDLAKSRIREGDVFIISPEQDEQTLSTYYNAEAFWQAADGRFGMLSLLPSEKVAGTIAAFPAFAGKKLYYFFNGAPDPQDIYNSSSFNAYGDVTGKGREYNIMTAGYNPNQPVRFDKEIISDDFIGQMNEFAEFARSKGAEVYYHFCPSNKSALEEGCTEEDVDDYFDYLQSRLDFQIIGNPHESILDEGWFYDTNFHLNDSGALYYTKTFIEDIKLALGDTSVVDVPVPSMPERPQNASDGDNSCADFFEYEKTDDGIRLTGLTAKGVNASEIVIPFRIDGIKVTDYAPDLFAGNASLTSITFQANMGVIYDGSFDGCMRLERIVLTSSSPNTYSVGDNLLEGTDARIYVPHAFLETYRTNYSWQKYSMFIFAAQDA